MVVIEIVTFDHTIMPNSLRGSHGYPNIKFSA